MRIAIIHHRYQLRGGMETYLLDLLAGFREQQDTVELFAQKVDPGLPSNRGLRVHDLSSPWVPHRLRPLLFASKVRRTIPLEAFDLVISLTRTDRQDLVVCGGTHRGYLKGMNRRPGLFDRLQIRLEIAGFSKTTVVVAHSRKVASEIIDLYGIAAERVVTLYPPIDRTRFYPVSPAERNRCRRELGINPQKTTLLFVGSAQPYKGYGELLEALKLLPVDRYELIVAGRCPKIRQPNVRRLGFVRDMRMVYGAADLTVLPSRYEAFGLVVAESLQCGTPVVVSDRVGAGELVGPTEGLIFSSIDPAGIARAIETASRSEFTIAPDFAGRNGLLVHEHIIRIKQAAARRLTVARAAGPAVSGARAY